METETLTVRWIKGYLSVSTAETTIANIPHAEPIAEDSDCHTIANIVCNHLEVRPENFVGMSHDGDKITLNVLTHSYNVA
jgi:hypothetical protein